MLECFAEGAKNLPERSQISTDISTRRGAYQGPIKGLDFAACIGQHWRARREVADSRGVWMFENVRADIAMAGEQNVGSEWDRRVRVLFQPGTLAVLSYRFCHAMRSIRVPVLRHLAWIPVLLVRGLGQVLTGVHISSKARIGPGFVIHTVYGIFISPTTIGTNCSVQTGVVLGYGVRAIGDDVLIGAGAKIVGPVRVGSNVVIAPNSLVVTDVPDNTTVAGVPARISIGRMVSTLTVLGGKTKTRNEPEHATESAEALEPEEAGTTVSKGYG